MFDQAKMHRARQAETLSQQDRNACSQTNRKQAESNRKKAEPNRKQEEPDRNEALPDRNKRGDRARRQHTEERPQ